MIKEGHIRSKRCQNLPAAGVAAAARPTCDQRLSGSCLMLVRVIRSQVIETHAGLQTQPSARW